MIIIIIIGKSISVHSGWSDTKIDIVDDINSLPLFFRIKAASPGIHLLMLVYCDIVMKI